MAKIVGGVASTTMPVPDWEQTNPRRADYIKNKPVVDQEFDELSTNAIANKVVTGLYNDFNNTASSFNARITDTEERLDGVGATAHSAEEIAISAISGASEAHIRIDNEILPAVQENTAKIGDIETALDGLVGGGGTWEKIADITTTEEVNGIFATVEEFPNIAKCKEFIIRAVYQPSTTGSTIVLGSSRLDFITYRDDKSMIFRFNSTTVPTSGLSEHRCNFFLANTQIQSIGLDSLTGYAASTNAVRMVVGDRVVSSFSAITYYNNDKKNLPIGTQLLIYGKVEG